MLKAYWQGHEVVPTGWLSPYSGYKKACQDVQIPYTPSSWLHWYLDRYGSAEGVYLDVEGRMRFVKVGEVTFGVLSVYKVTWDA